MTRRWTLTLLVLTAAAAFSAGRFSLHTRTAFDPARDLNPAHLATLLGLSEAQAADVNRLNTSYTERVQEACDAHCAARCQLAVALDDDTLTREQARALVEKMCGSQKDNELATLDHILNLREVLTPEQRRKFADTLGSCLCATCAAGGSSCCAPTNHEMEIHP